jgi:hypothetical protein
VTKLTALRVTVPTDDEVTTEDLQLALRGVLEAQPLSRIAEDGIGGRIHWAAVDVRRIVERTPEPRLATPSRRKKAAAPQETSCDGNAHE